MKPIKEILKSPLITNVEGVGDDGAMFEFKYKARKYEVIASNGGTAKLESQGGTNMKEYKCDFCYESHELVDHSSPLTELITGPWEEAFAHLKASDEIDAPEDLIHGLPFRYSMMIWRKGHQAESAIIYNLESSEEAGMMILSPGFLGPLCCPVCGRPLNEEEE